MMARELFTYEQKHQEMYRDIYLDCTLRRDIGMFHAGDKIDRIEIDKFKCTLSLRYKDGTLIDTLKLHYTVGNRI